uniref:Uncharacterized protein n=1 Tax=Ditylenchus dipsaci TaxID=166011 RepID=A0A915DGW2_9BILA
MLRRISSSISGRLISACKTIPNRRLFAFIDLLNMQHHKCDNSIPSHLLDYPLHYAVHTKNLDLLNKLLSKPTVFIDQEDDQGRTALHCAMSQTCHQIVECLLQHRANVDCVDYQGSTAAHLAVKQRDLLYLNLLLEHNADCLIGDRYGKSTLDLVCEYGEQAMFEILVERGVLSNLVYQLSTNQNSDNACFCQSSALGLAARNGHITICAELLEHQFPINVFTAQGSALHESCINGEWQVVRLLLYKGIDHTITDICGQTALHIAQTYLLRSKWSVAGEEAVSFLQITKVAILVCKKWKRKKEARLKCVFQADRQTHTHIIYGRAFVLYACTQMIYRFGEEGVVN